MTRAREHLLLCGNIGRNRGMNWADNLFPSLGLLTAPPEPETQIISGGIAARVAPLTIRTRRSAARAKRSRRAARPRPAPTASPTPSCAANHSRGSENNTVHISRHQKTSLGKGDAVCVAMYAGWARCLFPATAAPPERAIPSGGYRLFRSVSAQNRNDARQVAVQGVGESGLAVCVRGVDLCACRQNNPPPRCNRRAAWRS